MRSSPKAQKTRTVNPDALQRSIERYAGSLGAVIRPELIERLTKSLGPKGVQVCVTYAMGLDDRDSFLSSLRSSVPKLNVDRLMSYLDMASAIHPRKQEWDGFWSVCSQIEKLQLPSPGLNALLNDIVPLLCADPRYRISISDLARLRSLDADRFQAALKATQRICAAGLRGPDFMDAIASASLERLTPSQSLAVLDCVTDIAISKGPLHWAAKELPALILSKAIDSRRLIVLLDVILDLLPEGGIFEEQWGRYGRNTAGLSRIIESVASLASQEEDFREKLYAVFQFWAKNRNSGLREEELALALQTRPDLPACLNAVELFLKRLAAIPDWRNIARNIAELLGRTRDIGKYYSDYELRYHAAITTEEEETSYDSYYGNSTYMRTQEHYHPWIEVVPCGERLSPLAVPLVDGAELERLFAERSWMYAAMDAADRSRALERCAAVRGNLSQLLDFLAREGFLQMEAGIASIYLIGSYPWSELPNDIDIFIIVEGDRRVSHHSSAVPPEHFQVLGSPLVVDIEIVGSNTLLGATSSYPTNPGQRLSLRRTLLYGSALMAGKDQFDESGRPTIPELRALEMDLKNDVKQQLWPELKEDKSKRKMKRAWRLQEIDALSQAIGKWTKGPV